MERGFGVACWRYLGQSTKEMMKREKQLKREENSWKHWGIDRSGGWDMCCVVVLWWEHSVGRSTTREEQKRETKRKCYWAGWYWRQVRRAWIIQNSRSWHRRGQDGVDGKRKPARRAEYNSSTLNCLSVPSLSALLLILLGDWAVCAPIVRRAQPPDTFWYFFMLKPKRVMFKHKRYQCFFSEVAYSTYSSSNSSPWVVEVNAVSCVDVD